MDESWTEALQFVETALQVFNLFPIDPEQLCNPLGGFLWAFLRRDLNSMSFVVECDEEGLLALFSAFGHISLFVTGQKGLGFRAFCLETTLLILEDGCRVSPKVGVVLEGVIVLGGNVQTHHFAEQVDGRSNLANICNFITQTKFVYFVYQIILVFIAAKLHHQSIQHIQHQPTRHTLPPQAYSVQQHPQSREGIAQHLILSKLLLEEMVDESPKVRRGEVSLRRGVTLDESGECVVLEWVRGRRQERAVNGGWLFRITFIVEIH